MRNKQKKTIVFVAVMAELRNKHYYNRLWMAARNISQSQKISRRKWLDEISLALLHFNGDILYKSGEVFPYPDIDSIFGDDGDVRWMSDFLKSDPTGTQPHAMSRRMQRVQLIDLYFRIQYPLIARHFGR